MGTRARRSLLLAVAIASIVAVPSAGAASSPPGDIPDNQAFVTFQGHGYRLKTPEGWARRSVAGSVTFADKYNAITIDAPRVQAHAPTVATARAQDVPALRSRARGFVLSRIAQISRPAGTGVLVTYRAASPPSAVTGTSIVNDVERYELWHAGKLIVVTVQAPRGSDNVDAWRLVTSSVRWTR